MIRFKNNKPVLIFLIAGGLLFFLHSLNLLRPLENVFWFFAESSSRRLYRAGNFFNQAGHEQNPADLAAEVDSLHKKAAALMVANSRCQEIETENEKLRSTLKFNSANALKTVVADIIAKEDIAEDNRGLVINRGANDGLRVGLGIISEEGIMVGKIVEVKAATAKICLTTSQNCQLAATLQNQDRTQGITDGDLGLTIRMNYIPQSERIVPGDLVISSGLGGDIPRGLVIGQVAKVYNASNEVWQEATIEPTINFDNLTVVSVVIP